MEGTMFLYLVQHGEAVSKEVDPERPLSDEGKDDVRKVASFIASRVNIVRLGESGKLRATQTAGILGDALGISPVQMDGLSPMDDPAICAGQINESTEGTMLVGHMPHMGKLASLLLGGSPEPNIVDFKSGSVLCLKRGEQGWSVQWMVTPELIKD
jgi:phosphohistidine phosphatase